MAPDRAADELSRWAAQQAPELLARARAEAVGVLREALVAAALAEERPQEPAHAAAPRSEARREIQPEPSVPVADAEPSVPVADPDSSAPAADPDPSVPAADREPSAPAADTEQQPERSAPADDGELVWVYCVLGASAPQPDHLPGIDERFPVERVEAAGLAALLSRVPRSEFAAEPLRANLNRLDWLERVARAHEAILEAVLAQATIVPLRLCTLYENEDGVRRMLQQEHQPLNDALDALVGREEWGVKLFVDGDKLEDEARATSDEAARLTNELERQSAGGAYMLQRRLERHLREVASSLASGAAADMQHSLEALDIDVVMRAPQNRELSQHEGEMLTNAACLVDAAGLERLRAVGAQMEARYAPLGARVELSGPWPPYNFVPGGDAAALA